MTAEQALRLTNRNLIAFDLVLGTSALLAPAQTLRVLGHDEPSEDAKHLFQRCAPVWLTFARRRPVFLDRRLLKLGIAVEAEGLGEAHDGGR